MKITLLLIAFALLPLQAAFTQFTYCRDFPRGAYERQCVVLKADGTGEGHLKRRESDELKTAITLSSSGRLKFLSLIAATNNLQNGKNYESKRKVADLGRKHLSLEMTSGTREAEFNYSDLKEVNALATFFDGLLNQQTMMQDLESATRYERLSVPQRLEQLEGELKIGRIGDPEGLVPLLDKIIQNDQILQYAREYAQQIKTRAMMPIKEK
jgi:hypothetical protein